MILVKNSTWWVRFRGEKTNSGARKISHFLIFAKIKPRGISDYLKIAKIKPREILDFLKFAKIKPREMQRKVIRENKTPRKLIPAKINPREYLSL